MNIPQIRTLAAVAVLLSNALPGFSQTPVAVQLQAATPPGAPRRDPFVKDKPDKVPDATPQTASPANPANPASPAPNRADSLVFTMEVYALAQEDAAQVLEASGSGEARHTAVLKLMQEGKARLETLLSNAGKSGQRSLLESIDEVRYASEYAGAPGADVPVFASAFETRNVGDTLEIEADVSADWKYCDLNIVPQRVRLPGFQNIYADTQKPAATAQPQFQTDKMTTSMTLEMGRAEFLGTLSKTPEFEEGTQNASDNEVRLAFGKMDSFQVGADTGDTAAPVGTVPGQANLEFELTFYSLDREAARQILSEGFQDGRCYDAVKALADKHEAKLERVTTLKTKSGQRAVVEEINEVRYATEFGIFPSGAKGEVEPTAYETRNAGLTLEIEPTLDAGGKILDINLVPQLVSNEGDLKMTGNGGEFEPQPLFECRKITTSMTARIGEQTFIGTFSHPGDDGVNGRKDTGRTWFGFIRGSL